METEFKTLADDQFCSIAPNEHEQQIARTSIELLSSIFKPEEKDVQIEMEGQSILFPASVVKMLLHLLSEMAHGNAISLVPAHAEFTTQQAADFLNVSRPFLVKLLEEGKLPFRKVGTHRRVLFKDLMEYKSRSRESRLATLAELQRDAQKKGMGY